MMKSLNYKITGVLEHVSIVPIIGTIVGINLEEGRYWCPECCCMVDIGTTGNANMVFVMPMGGSVIQPKATEKIVAIEPTGVNEGLFLKTVALLSGRETLDKITK